MIRLREIIATFIVFTMIISNVGLSFAEEIQSNNGLLVSDDETISDSAIKPAENINTDDEISEHELVNSDNIDNTSNAESLVESWFSEKKDINSKDNEDNNEQDEFLPIENDYYAERVFLGNNAYYVKDNKIIKVCSDSETVVFTSDNILRLFKVYGCLFAEIRGNDGNVKSILIDEIPADYMEDSITLASNSNETIIYNFLKNELRLNTAAACGVLANIEKESTFRNDLMEHGYTWEGGAGYGICQWTNYPRTSPTGRRTNLVNWCTSNGYNYKSLDGQLNYLKHELETSYKSKVYNVLLSVSNDAGGAYDAGYIWCYNFERPQGYNTGVSEYRGNIAKNNYWSKYKNDPPSSDNIEWNIDESYTNTETGFHTSGWVIAGSNINRLTYSINGSDEKTYTNWISRPDVNNAYPSYPQIPCGFKIDIDWSNFKNGKNTVVLKAYSNNGNSKVISDVYFNYVDAPSGYSIDSNKSTTYVYNDDKNNAVTISYTVNNNVYCRAKLIVEKNGSIYGSADMGTNKSITIAFSDTGTYYIYLEVSNEAGKIKGTNSSGATVVNVIEEVKYTLRYDANGGSGAPASETKVHNETLQLSDSIPSRSGYVFNGWTKTPSASKADYWPGNSVTENSNMTLYAIWVKKPSSNYYVKGDVNGDGIINQMDLTMIQKHIIGKIELNAKQFEAADLNDDGKISLLDLSILRKYLDGDIAELSYTIHYNANGGINAPDEQVKVNGADITLSAKMPTRTGYSFQGWAASSTATIAQYQPGSIYNTNANITLYAVWKANRYTISYNANGGSGAPSSQTADYGTSINLSMVIPTRVGHKFMGWAISSVATTAQYQSNKPFTVTKNITLYAVWEKIETVNTDNIILRTKNGSASKGGYVDIPVELAGKSQNISCFNVILKYDNNVMYPVSYTKGSSFSDMISTLDSGADMSNYNEVKFVWDSINEKDGAGSLFTVRFKIKENVADGKYSININNDSTMFTNNKLEDIKYSYEAGSINISDMKMGDVNKDGVINGKDVVLLRQYVAGWPTAILDSSQMAAADVTGDGVVNGKDIVKIRQFIAGWPGVIL